LAAGADAALPDVPEEPTFRDHLWLIGRKVTFSGNKVYRYTLDEFERIGEGFDDG
jgi:hypothetical protein